MKARAGFNIGKFNIMPFNKENMIQRIMFIQSDSTTTAESTASIKGLFSIRVDSMTTAESQARIIRIRDIYSDSTAIVESLARALRVRDIKSDSTALTETYANAVVIMEKVIEYLGDFKPGDVLIIDTKRFTVELNNKSVLDNYVGDFPNLDMNTNLIYIDQETARKIALSIKYKEQFI